MKTILHAQFSGLLAELLKRAYGFHEYLVEKEPESIFADFCELYSISYEVH